MAASQGLLAGQARDGVIGVQPHPRQVLNVGVAPGIQLEAQAQMGRVASIV